jgi:hypothetical protein
MSYLIFHNEQQDGPYEPEQILGFVQSGELPETVFVWKEGMADWTPANSVFQIPKNEIIPIRPPAIPQPTALSQVIDVTEVQVIDAGGRIEQAFDNTFRKLVSDEQDPAAVRKILGKINDLLTQGETVDYVCVQKKPVVTISPDAIVLTSRRFIVARPKLTGFTFQDFQWKQVHDVHLSEQMLGATISCVIVGGLRFSVDSLPKKQARRVYAYAQQVEEQMTEVRRERALEEKRAGAGGVNIQAAFTAPPQAAPQEDPMAQLTKLKQMLDGGLIEQREFDSKKAEILKRM